jgi:hypothetical protein
MKEKGGRVQGWKGIKGREQGDEGWKGIKGREQEDEG